MFGGAVYSTCSGFIRTNVLSSQYRGPMLCEAELIAKRAALRWLSHLHPQWTQQDLADALKMSRPWVSK